MKCIIDLCIYLFSSIEDLQPQETEPTDDSVTYHVSTNRSNRNDITVSTKTRKQVAKQGAVFHRTIATRRSQPPAYPDSISSDGKMKKLQRKHVRTTQRLLFNQWEQYIEGSISVGRLLRLCGRLVYIPDQ